MNQENQNKLVINNNISNIVQDIIKISKTAQTKAIRAVNAYLVTRNWLIGKRIDEELLTNRSNDYGKHLLENLSKELSKYGKGFTLSDLSRYHNFYLKFKNLMKFDENLKICGPLVPESLLPWTFYMVLLPTSSKEERDWYVEECNRCCWSKRQLIRNIKTDYYHRVLSHQIESKPNQLSTIDSYDYLKSIYLFEFLNINNSDKYKELNLEQALLDHLKDLILELAKGYHYSSRQLHLRSNEKNYYVDLVFYNSILKCNVLIDLKIGKISHKDIGQMELYLKLYDDKIKQKDDNPSIGIILSSDTNCDVVKYLTLGTNNHIVSAKYMTYLPTKDELLNEIKKQKLLVNNLRKQ